MKTNAATKGRTAGTARLLHHGTPVLFLALAVSSLAGCGEPGRGRYSQASLKMAFQPAHTGAAMNRAYAPLLEHLSSETGYEIQYVSSLAHDGFGAAVGGAGAAVAFCDPLTYLTLQRTQAAQALAAGVGPRGDRTATGVIAVAERSPLSGVPQLRGAVIAFVSRRSSEGYVSQALACAAAGLALPGDARLVPCSDMEAAAAMVRDGRARAAFLDRRAMSGGAAAGLRVLADGAPVPTWICASLGGRTAEAAERVGAVLRALNPAHGEHAKVLAGLGYIRFEEPDRSALDALAAAAASLRIPY